eukprot:gene31521-40936_t
MRGAEFNASRNLKVRQLLRSRLSTSHKTIAFKLTDIGEGIAEVELMKWFIKEGDSVRSFDRICEVQSDKATVEITSRYEGVIVKIHHEEGSIVKVGSTLIDIEQKKIEPSSLGKIIQSKPIATAAATSSATSSTSITSHPLPLAVKTDPPMVYRSIENTYSGKAFILTTPAVRKIAKENHIDLSAIQGTGPNNRILKEDLLNYLGGPRTASPSFKPSLPTPIAPPPPSSSSSSSPLPVQSTTPIHSSPMDKKRVPIRGIQRQMAKSMSKALEVQHLTYSDEIIVDKLREFRDDLRKDYEKRSGLRGGQTKLSYMPLLLKITSLCLNQYPMLNSTVADDLTEMIYHFKCVSAALSNTLVEAQLTGGTFTLSNIGSIGGTYMVPVLVVPQVTIGAFGKMQTLPRFKTSPLRGGGGAGSLEVEAVTIMNVSWSADHRVIDGATVAKFSNQWKHYIENPSAMLADLR